MSSEKQAQASVERLKVSNLAGTLPPCKSMKAAHAESLPHQLNSDDLSSCSPGLTCYRKWGNTTFCALASVHVGTCLDEWVNSTYSLTGLLVAIGQNIYAPKFAQEL
ncbi:hypothetical protein Y1Q_0009396 [Alligator mississippiensis]|uniref:Uncharacterized protein n=1 Tax=Alligator mississippiensis TaxID=8496 RepID=A0A151N7L5_ALLMI|nr:hypothetical protein Y1Q_0009396 [Alligator mississippiensis]